MGKDTDILKRWILSYVHQHRKIVIENGSIEDAVDYLLTFFKKERLPEKTILQKAGEVCNSFWVITKGTLRCFENINGKEHSYYFATAVDGTLDYKSFLTGQASQYSYESIDALEYFVLSKSDFDLLYASSPIYQYFGGFLARFAYLRALDRLEDFQLKDLKVRYLRMAERFPKWLQNVPQYYLASYLNASPPSLSRIRSEMSKEKMQANQSNKQ